MKPVACARLREAEALRDQRLAGPERTSFERHLATCDACSRELRWLEELAAPLRASAAPGSGGDELHARRERARLLQAFDQTLTAAPRPPLRTGSKTWRLAAAVVVLLGVGVAGSALFLRATAGRNAAPKIAVRADAAAVWSGRLDGPHPKLVLERGALFIRVQNDDRQAAPLLVVLPDGELEDIGTVFVVRAEAGHTTRVSVREGSVVLRIRGQPTRLIRAGETWLREAPEAKAPVPAAASDAAPSAPVNAKATTAVPAVQTAPPRAAPAPRSGPARADPAGDFRAAVALFEGGASREAAAAFARFAARHPRDARAEDAAYLHVLALQRAGAHEELDAAARAYLQRHPAGLRRVEVEALARGVREERAPPTPAP